MAWLKSNALSLALILFTAGFVIYQRYPAYMAALSIEGRPVQNLTLVDIEGKTYSIPKSGTVLLNFWATWCMPCRVEMPGIVKIQTELEPRGLKVFGISNESGDTVRKYAISNPVPFPLLIDATDSAHDAFSVRAYPTLVIVQDGVVDSVSTGLSPLIGLKLRKRITGSYF